MQFKNRGKYKKLLNYNYSLQLLQVQEKKHTCITNRNNEPV